MKRREYPSYLAYWGKAKPHRPEGARFHRLVFHSLDVAACAEALLRSDRALRERWARACGLPQEDAVALAVLLIALHDAGKLAPSFQLLAFDVAVALRPDLAEVDERLQDYNKRHDSMGFAAVCALLPFLVEVGALQLEITDPECTGPSEIFQCLKPWIAAVTGHHGKPPDERSGHRFDDRAWSDLEQLAVDVAALLPRARLVVPGAEALENIAKRSSWLLAGLAVLSDWLGSNQRWFPYRDGEMSLAEYWPIAQAGAQEALRAAGVLPCRPAAFTSFAEGFPALGAPTPLQEHAERTPLADGPQLFVLEESTGAGKTEAALVLARRLMDAGQGDGIYVALPTMATANGMHARIAPLMPRLFETPPAPSLVLAHSATEVRRMLAEEQPRDAPYDASGDDEEETASLHCTAWLADGRKKAMLAHVGVGTIDQALLGVLPAKHSPLRLLGLHRKVLIVDEVHAYDAYVSRLLERLLTFHAALGGSAILLSATLPLAMRERLANAFRAGLSGGATPNGSACAMAYPLVTHVSEAGVTEATVDCRPGSERTVEVAFLESEDAALEILAAARSRGACSVWVRNTIADALAAYDAAVTRFGREAVTLFHSRFALGDRIRIENDVLAAFGVDSGPAERAGRVVIATQVVEQSLDLDFDEMVSDLAPIDLLLQRAGRLRRHRRAQDGARATRDERGPPTLHVLAPPWSDSPDSNWLADAGLSRTRFVYPDLGQLWRTQYVLREHGYLRTPEDARLLIEDVFGADAQERIPAGLQAASEKAEGERFSDASLARQNAVSLDVGYLRTVQHWVEDTKTPTRLGDPTVRVRLGRMEGGRVTPLVMDTASPWLAWHLSELSVHARHIAGPSEDAKLASALADAAATMPDEGKWTVTVLLEQAEGETWGGTAAGPAGPTAVTYDAERGLQVVKAGRP